jgi:hypothetical protein
MTKGIQTKRIQNRDWEDLSAYLDGQLAQKDRSRLEKRLQASVELRTALDELRRTRSVIRSQPRLRAPRNFTLTPEMVGRRKPNWSFPSLFPALGMTSALASALLVVVFLLDLLGGGAAGAPSMAAIQVTQEASLKSYAATEAPAAMLESGQTLEAAPAAPQSPSAQGQGEAPAAVELPATEAPAMALEAVEAATSSQSALAATESASPPAIPTPAPMFSDTLSNQQEAISPDTPAPTTSPASGGFSEYPGSQEPGSPEQATSTGDQQAEGVQQPPRFWTPFRLLEAVLALIAVAAGTAAFLIRRVSSG